MAYRMPHLPMTLSEAEGHLCCSSSSSSNYSVFTHKLESARILWFKLYCQRWRTSQSHRQSRTLEKW